MAALNTDLYELTMAAGYFAAGKANETATFELLVRRLPPNRNFLLAAGLAQAVEYLQHFRFQDDEIDYLRSLAQFGGAPPEFFDYLRTLRFEGDVFAVPEGTPVFAGEPILIVRAPLVQAQIVETYLLSTIAYQTTIASKAARCVLSAQGRSVVEFGSRRAHSPEAGPLAARAAYIAGCTGTSNAEAGKLFGIPVFGTAAHSWVMAFDDEEQAFRELQKLLGPATAYLIDTYDPIEGCRLAIKLGPPMWGVRLDSGNLLEQSRAVRQMLDNAGFKSAKIMATNDLNEDRIDALLSDGAPIDSFGVGTDLATSADAPSLSAVYKLVELGRGESRHYTAKYSDQKATLPGAKQIFRLPDRDVIGLHDECVSGSQPLLGPVLLGGETVDRPVNIGNIRASAAASIQRLPVPLRSVSPAEPYPVVISSRLAELAESVRTARQLTSL